MNTITHYTLRWCCVGVCLMVLGCAEQFEEMTPEQVCLDTAYAVSNRVYTCTNDADQATQAFDNFQSRTTCLVKDVNTEPIAAYYDCPNQVINANCAQIETISATGDPKGYLDLSPKCPIILNVQEVTP